MEMFRRIFFAVFLAGALAGLVSSAIQQWRVVPLILEAERYETAGHSHEHTSAEEATTEHAHEVEIATEPWSPADGFQRTFFTVLATLLTGLGFAFIMAAVSVLVGIEITATNGILWGLGGFLAFSLMPSIGLSPELPGMAAADLAARQIWWWGTALATGAAIILVAKYRNLTAVAVGIVILAIPHFVGAPMAPDIASDIPAHLASTFAANALAASLAFWLVLGTAYGWLNQRSLGRSVK